MKDSKNDLHSIKVKVFIDDCQLCGEEELKDNRIKQINTVGRWFGWRKEK